MKGKKSHILYIMLVGIMIIYIILSNNMIEQLERNLIKKTNKIQNLEEGIQKIEMDLIDCKSKILDKEIKNDKEDKPEWQEFFITGYTANSGEQGTDHIVATMFNLNLNRVRNLPVIAVDPEVIPLYSIVEIKNLGVFIALDIGGLIKGNRIDILCSNIKTTYEITGEYLVRVLEKGITLTD